MTRITLGSTKNLYCSRLGSIIRVINDGNEYIQEKNDAEAVFRFGQSMKKSEVFVNEYVITNDHSQREKEEHSYHNA